MEVDYEPVLDLDDFIPKSNSEETPPDFIEDAEELSPIDEPSAQKKASPEKSAAQSPKPSYHTPSFSDDDDPAIFSSKVRSMKNESTLSKIQEFPDAKKITEHPIYQATVAKFEKEIYDLKQLLEVSQSLCSTLEFSTLIESILYTCMAQVRVLSAGIFVLDALDANELDLGSNYNGLEVNPNVSYKIPVEHPVTRYLSEVGRLVSMEELTDSIGQGIDLSMLTTLNPSIIVPLVQKNHLNGILVLGERINLGGGSDLSEYEKGQVMAIASLSAIAINNAALMERSSTDMMTHLKLKYFFYNVLTNKLDTALAQNTSLSVLMFDIDFFKKFNDTYGHACGDYVLQTVAKILKSCIRIQDLASRYGGEEFTALLNDTGKEDAMIVADRIRSKIEQYDFCYDGQHVQVTISVGVSVFDAEKNPVTSPKILVDQADQALYVSKRNGRNQVTFADKKIISEIKLDD